MNNVGKLFIKMGLLSLLSVLPLAAQIDNGVDFTASFPFHAGDAQLPAGNYRAFQPNLNVPILQVQSIDGRHSAFVDFMPTQSLQPDRQTAVTFEKYGDTDYLDQVRIEGEDSGIEIIPSQVETEAAANANAAEHTTAASGQ
jgi:hypothetical protein